VSSWERALSGGTGGGALATAVASKANAGLRSQTDMGVDRSTKGGGLNPVYTPPTTSGKPTGGGRTVFSTDPGDFTPYGSPDPYPAVLPSLSAAQLGALAERRRIADQRLKEAEAQKERNKALLEASAERSRESAERGSKRSIEDFMREAGGKSLARSPMIAGRFQRREGEDLRVAYGEIDTRLSTEIAALQDLVSEAARNRDEQIALIEQEKVNMQADLERLFPASQMYG
jgi:hypothetical protein